MTFMQFHIHSAVLQMGMDMCGHFCRIIPRSFRSP